MFRFKPFVVFQKVLATATFPVFKTKGSAGADVFSAEDKRLGANENTPVRTGVKVKVPDGWELQVRSRSGLALKGVTVANAPGTIDSDYRGEIIVILHSLVPYEVKTGDRIAQLVLKKAHGFVIKEGLVPLDTDRGEGGFGSTGV